MDLALNDPLPAVEAATSLLEVAEARDQIVPLRARGLARRQLGEFAESEADLRAALRIAEELGDAEHWPQVALTLAGTLVHLGRVEQARELLHQCIDVSHGRTKAEAVYQLATTAAQVGELEGALEGFAEALPMIREVGERGWEANLLGNRGTVKIYSGDYEGAIEDLVAALEITEATTTGPSQLCLFTNNLAYANHLAGDVRASIVLYRQAESIQAENGLPRTMFAHRCNAYLAAGMYEETIELASEAYGFHRAGGAAVGAIEAVLAGAAAALALGDGPRATELASRVAELDVEASFPVWQAKAGLIALEAEVADGRIPEDYRSRCVEFSAATTASDAATAARAGLARSSIDLGLNRLEEAESALAEIERACRLGSLDLQARWSELRAELAYKVGDRRRGFEVVEAGLEFFERHLDASPAYDIAHKAARFAGRLVELGAMDLMRGQRLVEAVELIESFRCAVLGIPRPASGVGTDSAQVTSLSWLESDGDLWCIEVTERGAAKRLCSPVATIQRTLDAHSFANRQLARRHQLSAASLAEARAAVEASGRQLDSMLFPSGLAGRVTLNASASLSDVVWGALPTLVDLPFTLVSAACLGWRDEQMGADRVAVLAGSELPHAVIEASAVADLWSVDATVDPEQELLEQLDGIQILHLAGHFNTNTRNPLLSEILLGPSRLRGSDLLGSDLPPDLIVLSGCHSGHAEPVGPVQAGFVSAALASGVRTVVATHSVVEDGDALVRTMTAVHGLLRDGESPAEALRIVRCESSDADREVAALLAVHGVGWWTSR